MGKGRDILLVDDEQLFREPIGEMLRNNGFSVQEASKGSEALRMFKKQYFNLLITDMLMPGMNGTQLIRAVQKISPATEAIVISAYGTDSTKDKLKQIGAFGYLDKPVKKELLLDIANSAIKSNRLIRLGFDKMEPEIRFNRERVLIADDDETILQLISDILCQEGYRVTSVQNGYEAFERILVNNYELIILDINMPRMNGIDTVKAIREQNPFVFILLISGEAESEEVNEALSYGADKFLPKPFTSNILLKIIEHIDFKKIKKKKEAQVRKEEKQIQKNYTLYHRLIIPFTLRRFRKRIVEAIILILAGMIIGAISAFIEFDFKAEKDPLLDRTDKLIDAVRKDWGK